MSHQLGAYRVDAVYEFHHIVQKLVQIVDVDDYKSNRRSSSYCRGVAAERGIRLLSRREAKCRDSRCSFGSVYVEGHQASR